MTARWRNVLRISGFLFLAAGVLLYSQPWSWVLLILGLVQFVAAGGFG